MVDIAKWCAQSEFFRYFFAGVLVLSGTTVSILIIFILTNLVQKHIDKKYGSTPNSWYKPKSIYSNYKFNYPYQIYEIDITGKRNANLIDYIDEWINNSNMYKVETGYEEIEAWKKDCENIILAS